MGSACQQFSMSWKNSGDIAPSLDGICGRRLSRITLTAIAAGLPDQ